MLNICGDKKKLLEEAIVARDGIVTNLHLLFEALKIRPKVRLFQRHPLGLVLGSECILLYEKKWVQIASE